MSGPAARGPRLWLQPERRRPSGRLSPAIWYIRDDGGFKRSTGFAADERAGAEKALAAYIAETHAPARRRGDPSQILTLDVLNLYLQDVVPKHARPQETAARITRLGLWWGRPSVATKEITGAGRRAERMSGHVEDVRTSTCQAYAAIIGKNRTASMDLELLRAAINYAVREQVLDRPVPVALPPKSMPRERWLTRGEVAKLVWLAWRKRRTQDGREDEWGIWKHLARWMIVAHYTGTRKAAILNASFIREIGRGFIDLDNGLWYRRGDGVRATKKRQPPVPLPAPLVGHLRRWHEIGEQRYVVEFKGQPIDRIDKAFRLLIAEAEEAGYIAPARSAQDQVVPHTFRHTAITWAMQRGMDPWDASGYFGLNLQTLLDTYGHHHPDHLREAAARMARPRAAGDRVRQG